MPVFSEFWIIKKLHGLSVLHLIATQFTVNFISGGKHLGWGEAQKKVVIKRESLYMFVCVCVAKGVNICLFPL